jgi:hypothetical protein
VISFAPSSIFLAEEGEDSFRSKDPIELIAEMALAHSRHGVVLAHIKHQHEYHQRTTSATARRRRQLTPVQHINECNNPKTSPPSSTSATTHYINYRRKGYQYSIHQNTRGNHIQYFIASSK